MSSTRLTPQLLAALRAPEAAERDAAFDQLAEAMLDPLYWHARRLVVVHEDAEDVVQESFVKAYDALPDFCGDEAADLTAWLYRIVTNTACTLLRARHRRRGLIRPLDEAGRELATKVAEECGPDADRALVRLQQEVLALPAKQRMVFNLRYYDALSYAQIARVLDTRETNLRVIYHHAVERLKKRLKQEEL